MRVKMTRNNTATTECAGYGHKSIFQEVADEPTEHCTTNGCSFSTTSLMRYPTAEPPTVKIYLLDVQSHADVFSTVAIAYSSLPRSIAHCYHTNNRCPLETTIPVQNPTTERT